MTSQPRRASGRLDGADATDEDRPGCRALDNDRRGAAVRLVVGAVQFDDGAGGQSVGIVRRGLAGVP